MNPFAPFFIAAQLLITPTPQETRKFNHHKHVVKVQKHYKVPMQTHKGHVKPHR